MKSTLLLTAFWAISALGQDRAVRSPEELRQSLPGGATLYADLVYRDGHPRWKLDLVSPAPGGPVARPAIVLIHGGGWANGDKRLPWFCDLMMDLAASGYVVLSINYRLTGDGPVEFAVQDVKTAVRWLRAHSKEYGVDAARIGVFGNSAGAHLAAMLALAGKEAGFDGDGPNPDESSAVQAAVVVSGASELASSQYVRPGQWKRVFGEPESKVPERARRLSPATYASSSAPPILLIHGSEDPTIDPDQSRKLHAALAAAGAKQFSLMMFSGAKHNVYLSESPMTSAAVKAFFARSLAVSAARRQR